MWFQFHYGSIDAVSWDISWKQTRISIPLWFDWCWTNTSTFSSTKPAFQFHYGSIDAPKLHYRLPLQLISIPLWFDWGKITLLYGDISVLISIPLWFDWGRRPGSFKSYFTNFNSTMVRLRLSSLRLHRVEIYLISIPLWFDWGMPFIEVHTIPENAFQFHYGSIEATNWAILLPHKYLFQFHYGSIEAVTPPGENLDQMRFQFHYGSIEASARLIKIR